MFLKIFLKTIDINFLIELSQKKKKNHISLGKRYVELCYLSFQYFDVSLNTKFQKYLLLSRTRPFSSLSCSTFVKSFILIFIQKSASPYRYLFLLLSLFRYQCFQEFNFPGNINSSPILCFQILQLFVILGLY